MIPGWETTSHTPQLRVHRPQLRPGTAKQTNKKKVELSIFTHSLSILNTSDLFKIPLVSNFCVSSAQVKTNQACSPRAAQLVTESELQRPGADMGLSMVTKTTRIRTLPTSRQQLSLFLDSLGQGCDRNTDKRQIKSELTSLLALLAASCFSQKPNQAPASSLSWRFPCILGSEVTFSTR